jgi:signal peptidase I
VSPAGGAAAPQTGPDTGRQLGRRLLLAVIAGVVLGGLLLAFGVRFVRVDGGSMTPTLRAGDVVVVIVLPGIARAIEPGDVVLARVPGRAGGARPQLVKRVARRLSDPEGPLFVLRGDHRETSRDSRSFGPIPAKHVVGRAWLVLPREAPWRVGVLAAQPPSSPATGNGPSPAGR